MITLEDCIAFCGLTEEEVLAIAEHEHLPEIAATALAQYLLAREHGSERIRDMIVDDIRRAQRRPAAYRDPAARSAPFPEDPSGGAAISSSLEQPVLTGLPAGCSALTLQAGHP
jgi:hypothetical protein